MKRLLLVIAMFLALPANAGRSFNGTSDIITIPAIGNVLDIASGQETVSLWIYPTTIPSSGEHDAIGHGTSQVTGVQFLMGFGAYGGSGSAANQLGYAWGCCGPFGPGFGGCGSGYTANTWYQVIFYINPTTAHTGMNVSGAVNCTSSVAYTGEPRSLGTGNIIIGKGWVGSNFQGYVADVAIWNTLLSASEMTALKNICASSKKIRPGALVGTWPLYAAASPEPDLSGNAHNGTLTGTTAVNQPPCTP